MTDKGIGKRFNLGERTVTRHLSHLRKNGKIKVHFEFGRRVITFIVTAASQTGLTPAPDRPKGARQIGGQNPVKGIQERDRAEYLRIANSTNNAEKFRVLAMLGQPHVAKSV
ncbi:hypothetical protein [Sphingomonas sp.]|uniref:hypothetical protein n=1 Tax=Sphingomonas sp. TaxID=28214 RepID=UPI003B006394